VFSAVQNADDTENDVILVGDFNLKPSHEYWTDMKALETMTSLIGEPVKTSIGTTGMSNLYDNVWFQTKHTQNEYAGRCGANLFFTDMFDSERFTNARKYVSDHVPVWAEFRIDAADDD